jgi:hypothetical protein
MAPVFLRFWRYVRPAIAVIGVLFGMRVTAIGLSAGRPPFPGTCEGIAASMVVTAVGVIFLRAAFIAYSRWRRAR